MARAVSASVPRAVTATGPVNGLPPRTTRKLVVQALPASAPAGNAVARTVTGGVASASTAATTAAIKATSSGYGDSAVVMATSPHLVKLGLDEDAGRRAPLRRSPRACRVVAE